MSETTTTTTSSTSSEDYDTYIDALEEYFDVEMTLEDFLDVDDLDGFFAQLILDAEAAGKEVDFDAFESALEDEIKDIHYYIYEQISELQAVIDSSDSTVSQIAQAELLQEECEELDSLADDGGEKYLLDAWDDGLALSAELSQTVAAGDDVTVSPENPQNGQNYTVTIKDANDALSGSSMNSTENETWADLNADGYKETNWDANENGVLDADEANAEAEFDIDGDGHTETLGEELSGRGDKDGDGVITAADLTYAGDTTTTVIINPEEGDTLEFSNWDESTLTAMYKVTKEDGTVYYITLENVTENTKIICGTIPTNLDSMPDYISSKSWEFSNSQYSYYYFQDGNTEEYADPNAVADTSKAYIYLKDATDHTTTIEPTDADFTAEKTYDVYCDANNSDTINLGFDEDTTLEFSYDSHGDSEGGYDYSTGTLTIIATDENGNSTTMIIHDFNVTDRINIEGGTIADSAADVLDDRLSMDRSGTDTNGNGVSDEGDTWTGPYLSLGDIIYQDGEAYSGRSESEITADKAELEAEDYPYMWTFSSWTSN